MKPNKDDKVQIVIHTKPNKIWVFCNGEIHTAAWRTGQTCGEFKNLNGNLGILRAAMLAWSGEEAKETTFGELEEWSQGWGAWDENC